MEAFNYAEFMALVETMRNLQKDYFKSRDKRMLKDSKELESKVDRQIKIYKDTQLKIF